jgi:hypothetical protein
MNTYLIYESMIIDYVCYFFFDVRFVGILCIRLVRHFYYMMNNLVFLFPSFSLFTVSVAHPRE